MIKSKTKHGKILAMILLLFFSKNLIATDYFFYIQFTDKANTPYSLSNPSGFLSERAIERRKYFHITCDSTDLPINPTYLQQLATDGFRIHNKTKWLNGATIVTSDSTSISGVEHFSFVKYAVYTGKIDKKTKQESRENKKVTYTDNLPDYGHADAQINQINGKYLHNLGYRGQGIYIGVLDAGFYNVDIIPAFNLLRLQNRLLATKDFVDPDSDIFKENAHGANVLSIMASDISGQYIGTAPDASFCLVRTENNASEYIMETDFWISGIEYLDSLGIDVVNSSLGYTTFDDPEMDFVYTDLNGGTTRISKAAELASKKGIIVVNSAGNEGNKPWKHISAPADAEGIIAVGAVTNEGIASNFSAFGPSSDGRVKPEIATWGSSTVLMNINGNTVSNGTSFSAPIAAGMMACLLQAIKENYLYIPLNDISQAVFESANMYNNPSEQLGYGIPDFEKAYNLLFSDINRDTSDIYIFADSLSKTLRINLAANSFKNTYIQILNIAGKILINEPAFSAKLSLNTADFPAGIYAIRIIFSNGKTDTQKIIIR